MNRACLTSRHRRNPYAWVAAGALAAGLGVAWVDGAAIAAADSDSTSTASAITRSAGPVGAAGKRGVAVVSSARRVGATAVAPQAARHASQAPGSPIARSAANSATLDPIQSLTRQLSYIFNNTAPTIKAGSQSGAGGIVTGTVTGDSNNGFVLAYSLGDKPEYGNVDVNATTGAYTYTPNAGLPSSVTADGFTIVANNGTAAQLPGLPGFAQSLLHALAIGIGVSAGDTADTEIAVSLVSQTVIGNPAAKVDYWQPATRQTAALAAANMVIGQLKREMLVWDKFIQEAKDTDSVEKTTTNKITGASTGIPRKMYNPGDYPETLKGGPYQDDNWIFYADANQLLDTHGAVVTGTYYSESGGRDDALINLSTALYAGESVIVYPRNDPDKLIQVGNVVTVLGIDFTQQQVYINDGARPEDGKGRTLSIDDFIRVWGPIYKTVTVKLKGVTGV